MEQGDKGGGGKILERGLTNFWHQWRFRPGEQDWGLNFEVGQRESCGLVRFCKRDTGCVEEW